MAQMQQTMKRFPVLWLWSAIIVLLMTIVISVVATLFATGAFSNAPSISLSSIGGTGHPASNSNAKPTIPLSQIQWAAPIPVDGFTQGTYTQPGKPGEIMDGSQMIASFVLLASMGHIDEAMKFVQVDEQSIQLASKIGHYSGMSDIRSNMAVTTQEIRDTLERSASQWGKIDGLMLDVEKGYFAVSNGPLPVWGTGGLRTTRGDRYLIPDPTILLLREKTCSAIDRCSGWKIIGFKVE